MPETALSETAGEQDEEPSDALQRGWRLEVPWEGEHPRELTVASAPPRHYGHLPID
jgi:hypothetical protein